MWFGLVWFGLCTPALTVTRSDGPMPQLQSPLPRALGSWSVWAGEAELARPLWFRTWGGPLLGAVGIAPLGVVPFCGWWPCPSLTGPYPSLCMSVAVAFPGHDCGLVERQPEFFLGMHLMGVGRAYAHLF